MSESAGNDKAVRVALDASFLTLPPSGIGTYVAQLIAQLPLVAPDLDVVLLQSGGHIRAANASGFTRQGFRGKAGRAAWDLFSVAKAARATGSGLLHLPQFSAPFRPSLPFVVTVHDVIPLERPEYRSSTTMRLYLAAMTRTVQQARLILAPSHYSARRIEEVLGIEASRIRVIPAAADVSFSPAGSTGADKEILASLGVRQPYLFNIAGFDVRKNLPALVEAFAILRQQPGLEALQLVIAGAPHSANPAVFPPLQPVFERTGVAGGVILTGRVTGEERLALYQGAAAYVTPSLDEGFGLTVLEAMACGVPVVAADKGALPEVVGKAGLLVEPVPGEIAAAAASLLVDPGIAAEMREKGLQQAARFSWAETARQTAATYREVLCKQGAG